MDKELLETYSDYLIVSTGPTTATGLSALVGGGISHDRITRFLAGGESGSRALWRLVKPVIRQIASESAVISIDDTIVEKPYTDENELNSWYFAHDKGRCVKGVNLITALYTSQDVSIPIAVEPVLKTTITIDKKSGRQKRTSPVTKNEQYRQMLKQCIENGVEAAYILNDAWYATAENMRYVKETLGLEFIMPLKGNRKVALSKAAKKRGEYVDITSIDPEEHATQRIYLKGIDFALLLIKQIFKNGDGSRGVLYLVTSDVSLGGKEIATIYKKRWKVEEYHQSLKGNASVAKSPSKTVRTQRMHILASVYAYVKLERLSAKMQLCHHAVRAILYFAGISAAFEKLHVLCSRNRTKPILA